MQRANESLIARGYVTWFDLTNMKGELHLYLSLFLAEVHLYSACSLVSLCVGVCPVCPPQYVLCMRLLSSYTQCNATRAGSTIDAMSDAVDGADVMLYGVSLPYKESGNCRLEANYA
jgi:hypothetical protein